MKKSTKILLNIKEGVGRDYVRELISPKDLLDLRYYRSVEEPQYDYMIGQRQYEKEMDEWRERWGREGAPSHPHKSLNYTHVELSDEERAEIISEVFDDTVKPIVILKDNGDWTILRGEKTWSAIVDVIEGKDLIPTELIVPDSPKFADWYKKSQERFLRESLEVIFIDKMWKEDADVESQLAKIDKKYSM